jgi:hypothetical protein
MAIIRSSSAAGQASVLALASAERAHRLAEEASERLRTEGRDAAERAAQARIAAAEQRAREAETRAETRVAQVRAEAEERLGSTAAALARALANLAVLERQVVAEAEAETVRLALAIAGRVLARTVQTDPAWMHELFIAALAEVPDRRRVIVCFRHTGDKNGVTISMTRDCPDTVLQQGYILMGRKDDNALGQHFARFGELDPATRPAIGLCFQTLGHHATCCSLAASASTRRR